MGIKGITDNIAYVLAAFDESVKIAKFDFSATSLKSYNFAGYFDYNSNNIMRFAHFAKKTNLVYFGGAVK